MIRNVVGIPTIAVGNIFEPDHVNTIIGAGRADLCAIARPHLADPAWTLHAAASQRYAGAVVAGSVPRRQESARAQSRARCAGSGSRMSGPAPLAGRHALVTGAGRGIGAAIAARLVAEGARVTLLARTQRSTRAGGGDAWRMRPIGVRGHLRLAGRAPRLRTGGAGLRRRRHPGQQRGSGAQRRRAPGARRALAQHARRQPHRDLSRDSRRAARHAGAPVRAHRQRGEHGRPQGLSATWRRTARRSTGSSG